MTPDKIARLFEKAAQEIDELKSKNEELRRENGRLKAIHDSDDSLSKVAYEMELEKDEVVEAMQTLTPAQRRIFEKAASYSDFSLGEESSFSDYEPTADDKLLEFMEA